MENTEKIIERFRRVFRGLTPQQKLIELEEAI